MATKLTVLLVNPTGPFHWTCQHIAAMATDLTTGRTFNIEYERITDSPAAHAAPSVTGKVPQFFQIYPNEISNPLYDLIYGCWPSCLSQKTLFSDKNFDEFTSVLAEKFKDQGAQYDYCRRNCADAVDFALNELFPERRCADKCCSIYKTLCCPLFFVSLGLSCVPAPPCACTTPTDTFDKACLLSFRYGRDVSRGSTPVLHLSSRASDKPPITVEEDHRFSSLSSAPVPCSM